MRTNHVEKRAQVRGATRQSLMVRCGGAAAGAQ